MHSPYVFASSGYDGWVNGWSLESGVLEKVFTSKDAYISYFNIAHFSDQPRHTRKYIHSMSSLGQSNPP